MECLISLYLYYMDKLALKQLIKSVIKESNYGLNIPTPKRNETRYWNNENCAIWVDITDLEYDDEIEKIKASTDDEDTKIEKVKERAKEIAKDKFNELVNKAEGMGIRVPNSYTAEVDPEFDFIDWIELVTPEKEVEL